jgi:hypothetical protein
MLEVSTQTSTSNPRQQPYEYADTIAAANKVNWRLEDIIGGNKKLDFSKPFMPEALSRTSRLEFLDDREKIVLNQIKGNAYLSIFVIVEEFILPFLLDHVRPSLNEDDYRIRAFLQFATEEAKHIQLFKMFAQEFKDGFGSDCGVIGPAADIGQEVLKHQPLAVALVILMIEWMTQNHYVDSVKDDQQLDPQFASLLKNHWLEEAQHAKLDTLMVLSLAESMTKAEIGKAMDEFLEIGGFLDGGIRQQAVLDLASFEAATGRKLSDTESAEFVEVMHQANRWTYIGSGMVHPKFLEILTVLDPEQRERIEKVSPVFC